MKSVATKFGPNVRADVAAGMRMSAEDVAHALVLQTGLHQRWQTFFNDHDLLLTPTITITPRPWTELYPLEIDGKPLVLKISNADVAGLAEVLNEIDRAYKTRNLAWRPPRSPGNAQPCDAETNRFGEMFETLAPSI